MTFQQPKFRSANHSSAMVELGAAVTLNGNRRGVVVGRGFDMRSEETVYDVRLVTGKILSNLSGDRLKLAGPGRRDVIGRDCEHNPKRAHHFEDEAGQRAA